MFGKKQKQDETMQETVARLNKEVPDDFQVVGGNELPPVLHMLLSAYFSAPEGARKYLKDQIMQVLATGIPRSAMLWQLGEYMPADELGTMKEDYELSIEYAKESGMDDILPDNSLYQSGIELAEVVDRAIKVRVATAQNEKFLNREALLDIIGGHATLLRGLAELTNVPADYDGSSDADESGTDS